MSGIPRLRIAVLGSIVALGSWRSGVEAGEASSPGGVIAIEPPEHGFYAKKVDFEGIPIKAPAVVADEALVEARRRLALMLGRLPDAVANLAAEGVELHIIGKDQGTSDLPEHRHLKGKPFDGDLDVDQRTRGLGGMLASCGEENLLRLPADRYAGRDICLHEFAHTLREYGLSADLRGRIAEQYRRSTGRGLWKSYAGTDDDEFFAELTMWYFGTRGDYGAIAPPPKPGRAWLERYDPEAFRLLDDLYSGRIKVARTGRVTLEALPPEREGTLKSLSADAPTTLRLVNKTSRAVQLFWLDYEGRRRKYATIAPGGRDVRDTFSTHPWLLTDAEGKGLAVFVAGPEAGIGVLQEEDRRR